MVVRQWRVLSMLISFGKMSNQGLSDGELAAPCPACPDPTTNLPPDWASEKNRDKYVFLWCVDLTPGQGRGTLTWGHSRLYKD